MPRAPVPCGQGVRASTRALTSAAPARRRQVASACRLAPVVITSSINRILRPHVGQLRRWHGKDRAQLAQAQGARQVMLGLCRVGALHGLVPQLAPGGCAAERAGQHQGLVKAALSQALRRQRHGQQQVALLQLLARLRQLQQQIGQAACQAGISRNLKSPITVCHG